MLSTLLFGPSGRWLRPALILLVAFCARGLYLAQMADHPAFQHPVIDAATYDQHARELAFEGVFSQETLWQAPFYPIFLAGVYRLTGGSIWAAHVVGSLLGALTSLLVYGLGQRLLGSRVGLGAGLIHALYGPAIFFEAELLSAGWAALASVALVWLALAACDARSRIAPAALGVTAAVAVLVRATYLPFLAAVTLWLLWRWRRDGAPVRTIGLRLGALVVAAALVLVPFAELTRRVAGRPVIIPPSGGINLYLGNNSDFEHTVNARPGREWSRLRALPEQAGVRGADVWSREDWYVGQVRRFVREQPGEFTANLGRKALHLVCSRELPRNVDLYPRRGDSWLLAALTGRWGRFGVPFGLLLPLAAVGLVARRRELPAPVYLLLGVFALTIVAFFVSARFRLVLVPVLCIAAAGGVGTLACWIRTRAWSSLTAAVAAMIALGVLASAPGPFAQEKVDLEPELHYAVGFAHYQAERWPEAEVELRRATELRPGYPEALNVMGIVYYRQNRLAEAVACFQASQSADPEFPDVQSSLRVVREEKQRCLAEAWRRLARRDRADAAEALFFANRAASLSTQPDPCVAGVRALAFAAVGDSTQAHTAVERALVGAPFGDEAGEDCAGVSGLGDRLKELSEALSSGAGP